MDFKNLKETSAKKTQWTPAFKTKNTFDPMQLGDLGGGTKPPDSGPSRPLENDNLVQNTSKSGISLMGHASRKM